ncbi:MAG: hypothetical protein EZS28_023631, partial [Streblomastix strix]
MSSADIPITKTPFRQGDVVKDHYVLGTKVGIDPFEQIFFATNSIGLKNHFKTNIKMSRGSRGRAGGPRADPFDVPNPVT